MTDMPKFDRDNLTRATAAASSAMSRQSAVAQLIKLLKEAETPEGIALIRGFSQSLRLYENGVPTNRPSWISNDEGTRTEPQTLDIEVLAEAASDPEASDFTRTHRTPGLQLPYESDGTCGRGDSGVHAAFSAP